MAMSPNRILFCACALVFTSACQSKPEVKRYPMTGAVVVVHADTNTLTVHNDDVPGFMTPMDMDYKVKDPKVIESLKSGDKIKATIVIEDHNPAQLEDVTPTRK